MPIFEYHCQQCNAEFELLLPTRNTPARCPECDSQNLERKFSSFAVSASGGVKTCKMAEHCAESGGHCCNGSCCHHH